MIELKSEILVNNTKLCPRTKKKRGKSCRDKLSFHQAYALVKNCSSFHSCMSSINYWTTFQHNPYSSLLSHNFSMDLHSATMPNDKFLMHNVWTAWQQPTELCSHHLSNIHGTMVLLGRQKSIEFNCFQRGGKIGFITDYFSSWTNNRKRIPENSKK